MPDVAALARAFDYVVPAALDARVGVGTIVRVPLHGRRVAGWVVGRANQPETDRRLQAIARVTGHGPDAALIDLAHWAAWRWAGSPVAFLRAASPEKAVVGLPPRSGHVSGRPGDHFRDQNEIFGSASSPVTVRLPPAADPVPYVLAAAARGDALVLAPTRARAAYLSAQLRRSGCATALLPGEWARAAAGGCVAIGARGAAWAPRPKLDAVVVLDEHDEGYQNERAPTWNARDVAVERARRAGVPCVLLSSCPSLESLAGSQLLTLSRDEERAGWPVVEVVDRRREPPGLGLYSERLVALVRQAGPGQRVVCVLNRKGRVRLVACAECSELARCESCAAAVEMADQELHCRRCGVTRPVICLACGATRLKAVRVGVTRVREELELLAGQPVGELTGDAAPGSPPDVNVIVGTSATLHRLARARVVAFLDLDQELLAPRYRAAEEAMALVAQAARLVGGRDGGGRVLLQTRLPDHEVIDSAVHADPSRLAVVEAARRAALGFPPERALALVSGDDAEALIDVLRTVAGIDVSGPSAGRWLVRAPDHTVLCDALAAHRPLQGGPRVAVDPLRI
ncbi:MAG: hypothetical protein M3179_08735 [Actinomycetota bacterium]|nr:hypothetical protein [Actinomycetota bacterium]